MFISIDVAKDRLDVHVRPTGEAFTVARDGEGFAGRPNVNIQAILRHIDADEHGFWLSFLRLRACGSAPATVRDQKRSTAEAPRSGTGLAAPGAHGFSADTAPTTLRRCGDLWMQGEAG